MTRRRAYVLTGGTLVHVAPHFSLCAPAYGRVGEHIHAALTTTLDALDVILVRSKMALGSRPPSDAERQLFAAAGLRQFETNDDLATLLGHLVAQPDTAVIVLACAVCDWAPHALAQADVHEHEFGKARARLDSRGGSLQLELAASEQDRRPADVATHDGSMRA